MVEEKLLRIAGIRAEMLRGKFLNLFISKSGTSARALEIFSS